MQARRLYFTMMYLLALLKPHYELLEMKKGFINIDFVLKRGVSRAMGFQDKIILGRMFY